MWSSSTKSVFSDRMRMTFLKIPMMDKNADECETTLERWLYILKHMEKMEAIPQSFTKDPVFRNLNKVARYAALNEQDRIAYKKSLKAYRDAYAIAETERAEGRAEGRAEEKRDIARKMLEKGMDAESVASFTGLSMSEISSL